MMSRDHKLDHKPPEWDEGDSTTSSSLSILDAYGQSADKTAKGSDLQTGKVSNGSARPLNVNEPDAADRRSVADRPDVAPKASTSCMHVSDKGLKLIEHHEGLRLHPYKDLDGTPAIGY